MSEQADREPRLLLILIAGIILGFLAGMVLWLTIAPIPADAQGVGIFTATATGTRTNCNQITNPVAGQTVCFNPAGEWVYYNGASFTQAPAAFNIFGGGPHLIGWGDATITLANSYGIMYNGVVAPVAAGNGYGLISAPNFTKASSGVHPVISGTELDFPHITAGSGSTITNIAAVRIGADNLPPYGNATNVYGLWVVNGVAQFQGGNNAALGYPAIRIANNQMLTWYDKDAATVTAANLYQDTSDNFLISAGKIRLVATSISLNATQTFFNGPTTGTPRCIDGCGTSPAVIGTNSAMRITMSATGNLKNPFTIVFNGTFDTAPSCITQLGTATNSTVSVTNTTTTGAQVNTFISPAQGVVFNMHCLGVQ